jgi:hypothetical protein
LVKLLDVHGHEHKYHVDLVRSVGNERDVFPGELLAVRLPGVKPSLGGVALFVIAGKLPLLDRPKPNALK